VNSLSRIPVESSSTAPSTKPRSFIVSLRIPAQSRSYQRESRRGQFVVDLIIKQSKEIVLVIVLLRLIPRTVRRGIGACNLVLVAGSHLKSNWRVQTSRCEIVSKVIADKYCGRLNLLIIPSSPRLGSLGACQSNAP
jgi:hypothetical protein